MNKEPELEKEPKSPVVDMVMNCQVLPSAMDLYSQLPTVSPCWRLPQLREPSHSRSCSLPRLINIGY